VLFLAAGVGKPQVNELHVVIFEQFKNIGCRHFFLLVWGVLRGKSRESHVQQELCPAKSQKNH